MAEGLHTPDCKLRSKDVDSIPGHASNISTPVYKKINKAPSVRVITIFSAC